MKIDKDTKYCLLVTETKIFSSKLNLNKNKDKNKYKSM